MSNWAFLNKHRKRHPFWRGPDVNTGWNGLFEFNLPGLETRPIRCVSSNGHGWEHVSVSFPNHHKSCPSWPLMCAIKDLFWDAEDTVVQFHPAKSQYVNNHPGCLHLWRPTEATLPVPDMMLIGIPGVQLKTE